MRQWQLAQVLRRTLVALCSALAGMVVADSEAEAINRVHPLEELKAVCAAAKARETVAFDRHRSQEGGRSVERNHRRATAPPNADWRPN